jgi:hypothetical protein
METSKLSKKLAKMHPAQINWAKAKALHDTLQEIGREKNKAGTKTDADCKAEWEALQLWREATRQLVEEAKNWHIKRYGNNPELIKLYEDDLSNYMMVDLLPNWWQSKMMHTIMQAPM